jgi:hypothetical protein
MSAIKFTLGRALFNLFWGGVGKVATIFGSTHKSPSDSEVISVMSKASRQPLRWLGKISQTGTAAPTVDTGTNTINDLGGTIVWTRTSQGLFKGTLAGAFKGTVIEKTYIDPLQDYSSSLAYRKIYKNDDDSIILTQIGPSSVAEDYIFNLYIEIEVLQPITD